MYSFIVNASNRYTIAMTDIGARNWKYYTLYISRVIHGVMQQMGYSESQIDQYFQMSDDRGSSNSDISNYERITDDKFLMDGDEIKVRRIVVYAAGEYYKKFVYAEAYPKEETGLYPNEDAFIDEWTDKYGYYYEEYAEYEDKKITIAEYDDGATVIDGKVIDLKRKAKELVILRHTILLYVHILVR